MSTKRFSTESRLFRHLTMEVMEDRVVLSANPFDKIDIVTVEPTADAVHDTVMTSTAVSGDELETLALLVPQTGNSTYYDMLGLNDVKNLYGLDGSGQTVVIIDSGIAYNHVDLGGGFGEGYRVVGGYDFANNDWNPYDAGPGGSHGTHVAGIIASSGSQYPGVATGVDLVALRIFDDNGASNIQYLIDALQWVHENKDAFANPITTINLSVGFQADTNGYYAQVNEWFRILNDDGIFISVAAGNSFESIADKSQLSYPAMSEYVVSVGSVGMTGQVSYFSQRNETTIMAPGQYVKSTVPDYIGNRNGIDDDYSTFSGTSMATPYIAGASTLIRQAMQIVGMTGITQQMIYDVIVATADKIYDAVTDQYFSRLNIKNAVESVMTSDTPGNTIEESNTGETTVTENTENSVIDVISDNQTSENQTGDVTVNVSDAVHATVDQTTFDNQRLTEGGKWYAITATNTGTMTLEVLLPAGTSEHHIVIEMGDASGNVTATYIGQSRLDFNTTAGTTAWVRVRTEANTGVIDGATLRLTNLMRQVGTEVFVIGTTTGNDEISWAAGTTHILLINGVLYSFDAGAITNVNIDARGGGNTVHYTGSGTNESIVMTGTVTTITGKGLTVGIRNAQNLDITNSGGNNTLYYYATTGDDLVTVRTGKVTVETDGFTANMSGLTTFVAFANPGGNTSAILYDSPGNDMLNVSATYTLFKSGGMTSQLYSFHSVIAHSINGGNNTATLTDTPDETTFLASWESTKRYSANQYVEVRGYTQVNLTNVYGGKSTVLLEGSPDDDTLYLMADSVSLNGLHYGISVRGFDHVHTSAVTGGTNKILIYDTNKSQKIITSMSMISVIDSLHTYLADGFGEVWAFGNNKESSKIENHCTDYVLNLLGQWEDALATSLQ